MSTVDLENQSQVNGVVVDPNIEPKEAFFESNAGDGTTAYDQYLHGTPLILCILSCFTSLFLIGLDQTITVTILEKVGSQFNGYEKIGWISSGYMLTMAVFAATWGKMSIIFGRKWSLLSAILLFEAGSLMCALASSMNILIGGRVLSGIGGGGIQTLVFLVGTEIVSIDKRALVFTSLGMAFAISTISGPLIGGALTTHSTWRWCFYLNLPVGGLAAALITIFFKPPKPKGSIREKLLLIDYVGTFLLTGGIVIFLLALTFGGVEYAWHSAAVIVQFIIGGIMIILFCIWNFKFSKSPIIPLAIVRVPQVIFPFLSLFFVFFCFMGSIIYLTTYFQIVKGYSAWETGVHSIPMIIPLVIASISSGILMKVTTLIKPFAVLGGVCGCVGYGCLTLLKVDSSKADRIGLLILPGFCVGFLLQTCIMSGQLNAPKEAGSTLLATAFFNFGRALGGAIGANISQAVFDASFKNKIRSAVNALPNQTLDGLTANEAAKLMRNPVEIYELSPQAKKIVINVVMKSIKNVFITIAAVACLTFVMVCFLSNKRIPKTDQVRKENDEQLDNQVEDGVENKSKESEENNDAE